MAPSTHLPAYYWRRILNQFYPIYRKSTKWSISRASLARNSAA